MLLNVTIAQAIVDGLKIFLMTNSLEDVNKKLHKLYMILILRILHSYPEQF